MTEKELKRLSRAELLELLLMQTRESELLQMKLEAARQEMENRELKLREAGNLADAVLTINGVFESTQNAAQQYLDNVVLMEQQTKECCRLMMAEADQILEEAELILVRAKHIRKGLWETTEQPAPETQPETEPEAEPEPIPEEGPAEAEMQTVEKRRSLNELWEKISPKLTPLREFLGKVPQKFKSLKELLAKVPYKLTPLAEFLAKVFRKLKPLTKLPGKAYRKLLNLMRFPKSRNDG